MIALILCLLLQVADGLLTYVGVSRLGISIEGNEWIRHSMLCWGVVPALIVWKGAGCMLISLMYLLKGRQIVPALYAIIIFYLGAVVIPWIYVLSTT